MPRQKRTAASKPEEQSTALALPDTLALVFADEIMAGQIPHVKMEM